jgi:ferredoxin
MVEQTRPGTMRIHVEEEKCQGHNRCFVVAPELFELDDYGYAHEVNEGVVPPEHEEKARLAVANCPEQAIIIIEE